MDLSQFRDEEAKARALTALKKLQLFQGLSPEGQEKVLELCNSYLFFENEVIFREGDPSEEMFVVLGGAVEILVEGTGKIGTLRGNQILGEMGMLCRIARTATAVARERSGVLRIGRKDFDALLDRDPKLGLVILRNVVGFLTERLVRSNEGRTF